jgi:integrase
MESFLASRIDVDERTVRNHRTALRKAGELFGHRDPASLTADEVAAWVADLAKRHKPGTVRQYLISLRLLLDFAGLDEKNPARDPRVKLPKRVREEPAPPLAEHMEAILAALPDRFRLLLVTIEQGALRLGEACGLRWGDVDASGLRLRLPRSATKRELRAVGVPARVAHGRDRGDLRFACGHDVCVHRHDNLARRHDELRECHFGFRSETCHGLVAAMSARGEPLTSMRMNSLTDGNRIEPSWSVTLVREMPLSTKSLASSVRSPRTKGAASTPASSSPHSRLASSTSIW